MGTIITAGPTDLVSTSKPGPVVIDLGKKKKSQVKKLRKGRGKLMENVNKLVADLRTNGTVQSSEQPVIIVVREKKRMGGKFGMF
jgi:hypothetical protein